MQFDLNSLVDLYDSDIEAIRVGPLAWMNSKSGTRMNLEEFRKTAVEKFADIGFRTNVKCYDTNEEGTYFFEAEIQERLGKRVFDYDRQVHEVVNNYLQLPDAETGFINTDKAMMEFQRKQAMKGHKH